METHAQVFLMSLFGMSKNEILKGLGHISPLRAEAKASSLAKDKYLGDVSHPSDVHISMKSS